MKKVILIGDSIRAGYQGHVESTMAGEAEFWHPEQNGGTSANVLAHLDEWVISRKPDLVHINAGLHDLARLDTGACRVDEADYKRNVRAILTRIADETGAKIIWALTTPVNEVNHHKNKTFDRFEVDVVSRNRIAADVCEDLGVPINDLFTVVMTEGRDKLLLDDGVHYTEEGKRILGEAVVKALREALA